MVLDLGQEIHKMRLEHIVVPENKEVLKKQTRSHIEGYVKWTQEPTEKAPNVKV